MTRPSLRSLRPSPRRRRGRGPTKAPRGKSQQPAKPVKAAPTVSEQAVHVKDRASAIFVIVVVGVFAVIFLNALFFGHKGMFSGLLPHATPVATEAPASAERIGVAWSRPPRPADLRGGRLAVGGGIARRQRALARLGSGLTLGRTIPQRGLAIGSVPEPVGQLSPGRWTQPGRERARPGPGWSPISSGSATSATSASSRR